MPLQSTLPPLKKKRLCMIPLRNNHSHGPDLRISAEMMVTNNMKRDKRFKKNPPDIRRELFSGSDHNNNRASQATTKNILDHKETDNKNIVGPH